MSDAQQKEFEAWACKNGMDILQSPSWANTTYHSLPTEDAWRGWKACLATQPRGGEAVAWMYESEDPLDGGEWLLTNIKPDRINVKPLYTNPAHVTASPELLSALLDCVHVMERELNGLAVIQPELNQARAAIAAATEARNPT